MSELVEYGILSSLHTALTRQLVTLEQILELNPGMADSTLGSHANTLRDALEDVEVDMAYLRRTADEDSRALMTV